MAGLIAQLVLLAALARSGGQSWPGLGAVGLAVGVTCAVLANVALVRALSHYGSRRLRLADWVTLARATLAIGVAALVADSFEQRAPVAMLVTLAAVALALDAVDGWVARRTRTTATFGAQRTRTTATFGARFDAEADAFLILVLSVYVARLTGAWVLVIGGARYAFLVAGWPLSWMRDQLPPRYWRKVVAATQGVVLTIAAAHVLPAPLTEAALLLALALLAESFGRDVLWLWRRRGERPIELPAGANSTPDPADPRRIRPQRRVRPRIAAALTILSLLVVWAALVAPDRPQALTPTGFMRLPLEGLVLVALSLVLPATARRVLAGLAGPALGLVVILKILDIGFFTAFERPFNPVGDSSDAGIGMETLRAAIGHTQADLVLAGAVILTVALLVLITLAVLRLTRAAAGNRRLSLGAVTSLGAIWLLCSLSGAQFLAHAPIASTSAAGLVVEEVRAVQADIHDRGVFANEIRRDRFRYTPGAQLLTGLRGRDVLLVFVESYGRVTVQGSSFAPAVDPLLQTGTNTLRGAGFSARSAFVNAPGFGGISWLAHSTLQSGVWANSQQRYNQLVATDRLTLSDAFNRAGWRTINFAPADDRAWPTGSSFYHYDKLYDRRDMGYRGPGFTYAPMPDQFMFSALQRLELSKTHRRPVFAEVDTVSSHMPWNRIPRMIDWRALGDGSIFNRIPEDHETGAFWSNPTRVRAAYLRSIEYSLNTLISFVERYGKKNLVLLVVGDEQPLPIVSGQGASHEVPISIIAHDPSVLRRIGGWGWDTGLLPRSHAAVWPMSALRDRFLSAFGPNPATG